MIPEGSDEKGWNGDLSFGSYRGGKIYYYSTEAADFGDGLIKGTGLHGTTETFEYVPGDPRSFYAAAESLLDMIWSRDHDD